MNGTPLLDIRALNKTFGGSRGSKALDDVYLSVPEGGTFGLVGESGSGKSTLVKCIVRRERPDSGAVTFDGRDVHALRGGDLRRFRRDVQLVAQDPYASLNPRMTVEQIVGEGLVVHRLARTRADRRARVAQTLIEVGLDPDAMGRLPATFSGGQRQRIAIARALILRPRLLVCDEPVSALDVSVQAQVINLLTSLHEDLGVTILFIAHDLAIVQQLCSRVAVLRSGVVVEEGPTRQVFSTPRHRYTRELLEAVPIPDPVAARAGRTIPGGVLTLP
ncbi:ABC transporter ATP-binding protein [Rhodococcus sp. ACS1]|jgi:ABC-type oligopeptide transport system ATPase subunit|uniref:Oligopeptide transport system ATP-binding protein n=1 Tax=Rhodococcus koreensis TaxID=99653 RepID=A0A1H4QTA8_9NOCA|nr:MULTISPECIES: ATP-binding cassette domain-containing protein [Rhodococcus]PBC50996.1 ABC transporter ATP-binding protein [Rhodococcus sp. ACS1]QSE83161.1 ABC transporter ATP-binding protein [Rhodococcus koreensis]SEC22895.1 oligopeptide transport system ATP-binding protein [Rhodococcus koreensis]